RANAGWRPASHRTRLQSDVHAAGHTGAALWRRTRHGRRPVATGACLRPHSNAMVGRAARRFHQSDKPVVPVISGGPYGFQHINAAEQRRESNSLLNWTERIIRMRKEVPEVGWGKFAVLKTGDNAVLGVRYDWRNNSVLFLHNLADEPREVEFL